MNIIYNHCTHDAFTNKLGIGFKKKFMNKVQNMLQKVSSFLVLTICFYRSITVDNFRFGKKLPSTPFMVIDNLGMQMCCSECDAYAMCLSVNYNRKLLVCELNNVKENKSGSLITDEDFVYNEMADQVKFW